MIQIDYPISMPIRPGLINFAWAPESAVAIQAAEYTLDTKIYAWPGQKRRFTAAVGHIDSIAVAKSWQGFFNRLNGKEGTFLANDPVGSVISGELTLDDLLDPIVVSGVGSGNSVLTSGWPPGVTGALAVGDWISVANRLYQLLDDVSTDTNGIAELPLWPSPCGNLPVDSVVSVGPNAMGAFRLTHFPETAWNVEHMMEAGLTFTAEEE